MDTTSLLWICAFAFITVFLLLSSLAVAMHLIAALFPERVRAVDAVLVAAKAGTVATLLAGARVTRIEEEP